MRAKPLRGHRQMKGEDLNYDTDTIFVIFDW